jgi:hypothetical protein
VYHYAFIILVGMTFFLGALIFLFTDSIFSNLVSLENFTSSHGYYFILIFTFWYLTTESFL